MTSPPSESTATTPPSLHRKEQVAADLGTTDEEDSGLSRQGIRIPGVRLDESERPSFEISLRQKEIGGIQRGDAAVGPLDLELEELSRNAQPESERPLADPAP